MIDVNSELTERLGKGDYTVSIFIPTDICVICGKSIPSECGKQFCADCESTILRRNDNQLK